MKRVVNIARVFVGVLFIFSGMVKAIDPLGLAYKMQEFFEAWAADGILTNLMGQLNDKALLFSLIMITLEVILGVALLLGWRKKMVSWFLLLLMLFFTFLTSYVLFSGKIRACGCFGDCIPLTPIQTFTKDIILLILVLLILFGVKFIKPVFSNKINIVVLIASLVTVLGLQWYVLHHLPIKDCLPFKVGNNIIELRKMPKDAIPDKFDYTFIYEKDGQKKEFAVDALPDSTWHFADRKQVLVQKGKNNVPLINDFIFNTQSGNDTTEAILNQTGEYYLLFAKDFEDGNTNWLKSFELFSSKTDIPVYLVTADAKKAVELINNKSIPIFTCDATAIKTAARVNPTLFLMKGPVVKNKWAAKDKF
ncbi:MAG TPA: DoxX family membrane protein [Ferruginibacter sp.]|nr:DoxX family membrane protein [Ferruginibacter sp.]